MSFMKSPQWPHMSIRTSESWVSQTSVGVLGSGRNRPGKCQEENRRNIFLFKIPNSKSESERIYFILRRQQLEVAIGQRFSQKIYVTLCTGKCCSLDLNRDWTLSRNFPNLHSGLFIAHINILSILSGRWEDKYLTPKILLCYAKRAELHCYRYVRNEENYTVCS